MAVSSYAPYGGPQQTYGDPLGQYGELWPPGVSYEGGAIVSGNGNVTVAVQPLFELKPVVTGRGNVAATLELTFRYLGYKTAVKFISDTRPRGVSLLSAGRYS